MIGIFASSIGGTYKSEGRRLPTFLLNENSMLDNIKKYWKIESKVIIISASPSEYELNDSILECQKQAFKMSGLSYKTFNICDNRNSSALDNISEFDVLVLAGGHVPTQNEFFSRVDLKNKLKQYNGMIISWSAGSMNSAEVVYAQPELQGEGIDENYVKFIPGLGITKYMIIPHFQSIKNEVLDGLRVLEDITYPDSMGKEFIALNEGSYIMSLHGEEKIYGDAFLIKDGKSTQICRSGEVESEQI